METLAVVETPATETVAKRRGRPVVENSVRQQRLALRAERIAEGYIGRGRPVNTNSVRQQKFSEREAKIALGIEIKRGRPKMVKQETVEA
jgi:hypothetical protein